MKFNCDFCRFQYNENLKVLYGLAGIDPEVAQEKDIPKPDANCKWCKNKEEVTLYQGFDENKNRKEPKTIKLYEKA